MAPRSDRSLLPPGHCPLRCCVWCSRSVMLLRPEVGASASPAPSAASVLRPFLWMQERAEAVPHQPGRLRPAARRARLRRLRRPVPSVAPRREPAAPRPAAARRAAPGPLRCRRSAAPVRADGRPDPAPLGRQPGRGASRSTRWCRADGLLGVVRVVEAERSVAHDLDPSRIPGQRLHHPGQRVRRGRAGAAADRQRAAAAAARRGHPGHGARRHAGGHLRASAGVYPAGHSGRHGDRAGAARRPAGSGSTWSVRRRIRRTPTQVLILRGTRHASVGQRLRTGQRAMIAIRADRGRLWAVLGLLAVLHFGVRPRLGYPAVAPDFLLLALMLCRHPEPARDRRRWRASWSGSPATPWRPPGSGAGALAHTVVGYLAAWGRAVFFPDNLFVNGLVIAARCLDPQRHPAAGERPGGRGADHAAPGLVADSGAHHGADGGAGAGGVPALARHPARSMNEFHPTRLRERSRPGALGARRSPFWCCSAAFFRTQILQFDRYRLRAENNRLRPVPLQPARGTVYDRNGQVIAETVPGFSVALLALLHRFAAPGAAALPERGADRLGRSSRQVVNRYLQARYQPAAGAGQRDPGAGGDAGGASRHPAGPRGPVGAPASLSPRDRGGPPGRATSDEVDAGATSKRTASPGPGWARWSGGPGWSRSTTTLCGASPGMRYIEVDARGRLVREQGAAPPLPSVPGRTPQDHDRPRPAGATSTASGPRGQSGRDDRHDAHGRDPGALLHSGLRSQRVHRGHLRRRSGAGSTAIRRCRCSTGRCR